MMKFVRRFRDLGIEGAQAKRYDKMTREHRTGEMKAQAKEIAGVVRSIVCSQDGTTGGLLIMDDSRIGKEKIMPDLFQPNSM